MLINNIVNNFFPAYKNSLFFQKEFLLNVQNSYALIMTLYLMAQLCNCIFYDKCANLVITPQKFMYYFVIDALICEPIMHFHHIISFALAYTYRNNIDLMISPYNLSIGFGTIEISTVFLTIRAILRNYKRAHPYITLFYNINDKIFIITFFYTRIYLYYWQLLRNENVNKVISQFPTVEYHIFNTCLYLLYFLNLYWACQILQLIARPLLVRITT